MSLRVAPSLKPSSATETLKRSNSTSVSDAVKAGLPSMPSDMVSSFLRLVGALGVFCAVTHHGLGLAKSFATAENILQIRHFFLWQNSQADIQRTGMHYTTISTVCQATAPSKILLQYNDFYAFYLRRN